MRKFNCIAIDDEPIALLVIKQFCERKGNIELKTFCEPRIGLEEIKDNKPDIVFLDIEMNGLNGLEIAKQLPDKCCLIFTTAHAQYALNGFDLDAVDFLHKPIAYDRFERAIEKAMRHISTLNKATISGNSQGTIVVKQEYNNINIHLSDIFYIEALENYCKIYRTNGNSVISRLNIKTIHKMLPENTFLRVHRSFLVPIHQIQKFTKQEIWLKGSLYPIPIGRRYAKEIYEFLTRNE